MRELAELIEHESQRHYAAAADPELAGGWRETMHREFGATLHNLADAAASLERPAAEPTADEPAADAKPAAKRSTAGAARGPIDGRTAQD